MSEGNQGRRANDESGPRMDTEQNRLIGGDSFTGRQANPEFLKKRMEVYATIKARREEELAKKVPAEISVTLPDGKVLTENKDGTKFQAWKTTPYDVAVAISQGLADASVVARITYEKYVDDYSPAEDGMEVDLDETLMDAMEDLSLEEDKSMLWDMTRPLVGPVSKMQFCKFDDERDAKTVFWHSSAHMLGEALEHLYGSKLTIGPPLAGGFFYDSYMGKDSYKEEDCKYRYAVNNCRVHHFARKTQCLIIHHLQTSQSNKKYKRLSSRSKSLSVWSSLRKKLWSFLPTTPSSNKF